MDLLINKQIYLPGATEAVQNWVRNLLLMPKFRVRKTIIFLTGGPNIGCANAHPCALGSAAPGLLFGFENS